jgi:hypothetical protein
MTPMVPDEVVKTTSGFGRPPVNPLPESTFVIEPMRTESLMVPRHIRVIALTSLEFGDQFVKSQSSCVLHLAVFESQRFYVV